MDLELFPEDWRRGLVLMAHPDDPEYGAALAVHRWTQQGKDIVYALATSGEAGIEGLPPEQAGPLREAEQRRAIGHVGVQELEFLGLPDGRIEYGIPLRRTLAAAIRRHRPEVVVTLHFGLAFGGVHRNPVDHRALGQAVLDAVSDAASSWIFPDLAGERWDGVQGIAVLGDDAPTHRVPVGPADVEAAVAALAEHREYLGRLSEEPVEQQARNQVQSVLQGHEDAPHVAFRVYR